MYKVGCKMELAILLGGHWAGDYLAQVDWMAANKHRCMAALLSHCVTYTIFAALSLHALGAANMWTITAVFVSHAIIDHREWSIPWSSYPPLRMMTDQAAHVAVLVGSVVWVVGV